MDVNPDDVAAVQRLLVDRERLPSCAGCGQRNAVRVLYGYPTSADLPLFHVYGGETCGETSPTHFCPDCAKAWIDTEVVPMFFPFPDTCDFCGETLEPMIKASFQVQFETWMEPSEDGLELEQRTFQDALYAVCKECKEGIHSNSESLARQRLNAEGRAFVSRRAGWTGVLMFLLLALFCWIAAYI